MDNWDMLFETVMGDTVIINQFLGIGSFFNIIISGILGFVILLVYLKTNKKAKKDKIFIISIPVISVLMTMLMKMQGGNAIIFFGIFGVLSIVRFRSSTSQSDISFILFAVIIGVLIGISNYVLVLIGFITITVIIIIINFIYNKTIGKYYASIGFSSSLSLFELKKIIENYFDKNTIDFKLRKIDGKSRIKNEVFQCDNYLVYDVIYKNNCELILKYDDIFEYMKSNNILIDLRKNMLNKNKK